MNNNSNIEISEIMSTNLKTLHPKDKVERVKEIFDNYDIHHIPIVVMGEVRGIISLGDLLFLEGVTNNSFDEFLRNRKYKMSTVDEIMTPRPICIESDSLISEAIDIMTEKRINCLPVKENDELVGIITNFDLIKYFKTTLTSK